MLFLPLLHHYQVEEDKDWTFLGATPVAGRMFLGLSALLTGEKVGYQCGILDGYTDEEGWWRWCVGVGVWVCVCGGVGGGGGGGGGGVEGHHLMAGCSWGCWYWWLGKGKCVIGEYWITVTVWLYLSIWRGALMVNMVFLGLHSSLGKR